jgi:hypothetical protein
MHQKCIKNVSKILVCTQEPTHPHHNTGQLKMVRWKQVLLYQNGVISRHLTVVDGQIIVGAAAIFFSPEITGAGHICLKKCTVCD